MPGGGRAVTKGSFTVWCTPENPLPGQRYDIIIEVKVPNRVKKYRLSDLKGEVTGTDGYRQLLPWDRARPYATKIPTDDGMVRVRGNEVIDVKDNRVQLAVSVPGAARLIKDTIEIRSRILREEQTLELIFGQQRPLNQ